MKKIMVAIMMFVAMFSVMAIGPEEALAHEPVDAGFTVIRDEEYYSACADGFMEDMIWMAENHPETSVDVTGWGYALKDECIELYLDYINPETGEEVHDTDTMDYENAWLVRCYARELRESCEAGIWWF